MKPRWTPQQGDAIRLRGRNLLVSAAAGSGKTAVLVERIVQRVLDPGDPLEIDRILVVTFTEAAAGEMRERIGVRLERAVEDAPHDARLRRQSALLARASISTLHAFCLRMIRQHFHRLDLDPAVRALTEHEARLLRREVLEQLFEEQSALGHSPFLNLIERYGGRHDEGLQALVLQAHTLAFSQPWPDAWLDRCATPFELSEDDPLPDCWTEPLRLKARRVLESSLLATGAALDLCGRPGGPAAWASLLEDDRQRLLQLLTVVEQARWDDVGAALAGWVATKTKNLSKIPGADETLCERVRELRNKVSKPAVKELAEGIFSRPERELVAELRGLEPVARELARLVSAFDQALTTVKTERGVIDFGDMERLALRLLLDPASPPGTLRPSDIALGCRRRFEEVLIDEYQDINETQDAILQLVARDGSDGAPNRFMVGDVKQSIYRFRLAEPRLFLEKYRDFQPARDPDGAETTAPNARVDLNANFRSRRGVVDAVNFVFRQVMTASVGELDYAGAAELVFGAEYPAPPTGAGGDAPVEVHLLERGDSGAAETEGSDDTPSENTEAADDSSAIELEAAVLAARIRDLVEGSGAAPPLQVWDRGLGSYRSARYRDVVVLLRAASTQAPAMVDVLTRMGVPVYARASTGYFAALEVRTILALLQIIDNPCQDLPLATALRSSLVGMSDGDIAHTRLAAPEGDFFTAVRTMAQNGSGAASEQAQAFLAQLEGWRDRIHRGPLSRFIEALYEETRFLAYAAAMPGGEQRRANLLALADRAREFDQFARQGLFRFLRYIDRLQEAGEDLGTAPAITEGEDVVRVMTIHQSKGLEFPVVVVANLGGRFRNDSGDVLLDRELGLGPLVVDLRQRLKHPSIAHQALRERAAAKGLAEEMRLLYVALTRARERLILAGSLKNLPAQLSRWLPTANTGRRPLPDALLADATRYLDWLGPCIARHPDAAALLAEAADAGPPVASPYADDPSRWQVRCWSGAEAAALLPSATASDDPLWERIARGEPLGRPVNDALRQSLLPPARPDYPFAGLAAVPGKRTVSEIKRLFEADGAEPAETLVEPRHIPQPRFEALDTAEASANRGVATHSVLEHLDLTAPCDEPSLRRQLAALVADGVLLPAEASLVHLPALEWLFTTPLGRRLRAAADTARREWMFTAALPVSDVEPLLAGSAHTDETVLVQGVIDCLFEDAAGMVLVDYKTDRLQDEEPTILADRHRRQLQLYAHAVHAVYGQRVTEAYVVYLRHSHIRRIL